MVTKKYKQILVTVVRNHNIKKQNLTIYKTIKQKNEWKWNGELINVGP